MKINSFPVLFHPPPYLHRFFFGTTEVSKVHSTSSFRTFSPTPSHEPLPSITIPNFPVSHYENSNTWPFCEVRLLRDSMIYWILEKEVSRTAQVRLGAAPDPSGRSCLEAWINTLTRPDSSPLVGRLTPAGYRENPSYCRLLLNFQPLYSRSTRDIIAKAHGFLT